MDFLKSKTFKVLNIASIATLFSIVVLDIIASFVNLSKGVAITFIVLICLGALFVIAFNILSLVLFAKDKKIKEEQDKNEKK